MHAATWYLGRWDPRAGLVRLCLCALQSPRLQQQQQQHFTAMNKPWGATQCQQSHSPATVSQQGMTVTDKWQRRDDCRLGTGCVRFCDDIENGWGKGQEVNKKGMSKILRFKVGLSVLALAAPLSLKCPDYKIHTFSASGKDCCGLHSSPGRSGMQNLEEIDFSSFS